MEICPLFCLYFSVVRIYSLEGCGMFTKFDNCGPSARMAFFGGVARRSQVITQLNVHIHATGDDN